MRGFMPWDLMQAASLKAGLGKIVHVDPKPVSKATAYYLACYLTKGERVEGVRMWSNIGTYDGIGKRDILLDSQRIRDIKGWRYYFQAQGKPGYVAYLLACRMVDDGIPLPGTDPF